MKHTPLKIQSQPPVSPILRNSRWAVLVSAALAILALATACTPSKEHNQPKATQAFTTKIPTAQADQAFARARLDCSSAARTSCPEAVAMLLTRQDGDSNTDFGQCSAFLVSSNIIATNSHCLTDDLRAPNADCRGRIAAIFGSSRNAPARKYDCERILSASDIVLDRANKNYLTKSDYAFIQLSTSAENRTPLRFSRKGVADQEMLSIAAIDPTSTSSQISGQFRFKQCRATQNSVLTPGYTHDFASVVSMSGCELIQGNSGSAAIDASGSVRAIAYATVSTANNKPENFDAFDPPARFDNAGLFANAACIVAPRQLNLGNVDSRCYLPSPTVEERIVDIAQKTPSKADALFETWKTREAPYIFEYMLTKKESNGVEIAFPEAKCMKPKSSWRGSLDDAASVRLFSSVQSGSDLVMVIKAPLWSPKIKLGADYRISADYDQVDTLVTTMRFEKESLETPNAIRLNSSGIAPEFEVTTSYVGRLPTCGVR